MSYCGSGACLGGSEVFVTVEVFTGDASRVSAFLGLIPCHSFGISPAVVCVESMWLSRCGCWSLVGGGCQRFDFLLVVVCSYK